MLHPGDPAGRTRLVVRGPRLQALRISALEAAADPPAMIVEAEVAGRRYREDRDTTAVLEGSPHHEVVFAERWRMTLDGDDATPWRIAAARERAGIPHGR
jgi:predicted lipid-binding transport protein (Tim44 family)